MLELGTNLIGYPYWKSFSYLRDKGMVSLEERPNLKVSPFCIHHLDA